MTRTPLHPISVHALPLAALALAALVAAAPAALGEPIFTDVTKAAGVEYLQQHQDAWDCSEPENQIFCFDGRMTGGAAVGDYDGDGDLDLYVTRLDSSDLLFCNDLAQTGAATFHDCTLEAKLASISAPSNGAAWGDIDNDGDLDLFVVTLGHSRFYLFINDGEGHFSEEALARNTALEIEGHHAAFSVTFGDYDRDGWLDIHMTEWRHESAADPGPPTYSRLLRNRGRLEPGVFDDVTQQAGVEIGVDSECDFGSDVPCGEWGFASSFSDLDDDGWPDLLIAADFGSSRLFWNNRDGTFRDGTEAAGVGSDENGMGSSVGDIDGDGDLDWFVTSIYDTDFSPNWGSSGNRLYRNEGSRQFSDATDDAGVRQGFWGWGTAFLDYDNDGDLDLTMTNGVEFPWDPNAEKFATDPMRFWINDGTGAMTEASAEVGLSDTSSGKGLLTFDYDADGDLDIFVVNNRGTPRLYRNDGGNANHSLRVKTIGTHSNREGIGARVRVQLRPRGRVLTREIGSASHFLGQGERTAHFGLGRQHGRVAGVEIRWPSGLRNVFHNLPPAGTLVALETRHRRGCGYFVRDRLPDRPAPRVTIIGCRRH